MARIYADLIRRGLKTIDDVPANLRDAVQKILDDEGWTPPSDPAAGQDEQKND